MRLNTDGLIIREVQTGEADRLVTVLTRDMGVIKAFVRGARSIKSRSLSATQLLGYSRFSIYISRDTYTIDEAEPIEVFFGIRSDFARTSLAMYFCELICELAPEGADCAEILSLALNTLYLLANNRLPVHQLKAVFEMRLLSLTGYMPALVGCEVCGKYADETMFFDTESAQLFCSECKRPVHAIELTVGVVTALRHICLADPQKIFSFTLSNSGLKALADISERYLLATTQRRYKSLELYKSFT